MTLIYLNQLRQYEDPDDGDPTYHDSQEFVFLDGVVNIPSKKLSLYTRRGLDGVGIIDTHTRANPFTLVGTN